MFVPAGSPIFFLREHLNVELGRLCPFSAPRGTHFQLVPLGSPPKGVSWANFHP